ASRRPGLTRIRSRLMAGSARCLDPRSGDGHHWADDLPHRREKGIQSPPPGNGRLHFGFEYVPGNRPGNRNRGARARDSDRKLDRRPCFVQRRCLLAGSEMTKQHRYEVAVRWSGATSSYNSYSRNHEICATGKPAIHGSSDPAFRGDAARYNPEEMLVASLST